MVEYKIVDMGFLRYYLVLKIEEIDDWGINLFCDIIIDLKCFRYGKDFYI